MDGKGSITRTVNSFVFLRRAAHEALEHAEADEEGSLYDSLSCVVASAFFLEALMNHVGERLVPHWDQLERSLNPRQKLLLLSERIGFEPDFGSRPYQTFDELSSLRNLLAHGRTSTISGEYPGKPLTKWEASCNPAAARRLLEDAEELGLDMWERAGLPKTEWASFGIAEFWRPGA